MRRTITTFATLALALSLGACSEEPLPKPSASTARTDSAVIDQERLVQVLGAIEASSAKADAAKDVEELKRRFTDAALRMRVAAYDLAVKTEGEQPPVPLNWHPKVSVVTNDPSFPRYAAFVSDIPEGQNSPVLASLRQDSPQGEYLLTHWVRLFPGVTFPKMPAANDGVEIVANDSTALEVSPDQAIANYIASINDPDSAAGKTTGDDPLRFNIRATVKGFSDSLEEVGTVKWTAAKAQDYTVAYRSAEGGNVVFGVFPTVLEFDKTEPEATLKVSGDIAKFGGDDPVEQRLRATYLMTVALYIPPTGTDITPLGGEQALLKVERINDEEQEEGGEQ